MKFECEKNDEMQIKLAKIIGTQWKPHWSFMFITSSSNTTKKTNEIHEIRICRCAWNHWRAHNSHTRQQWTSPAGAIVRIVHPNKQSEQIKTKQTKSAHVAEINKWKHGKILPPLFFFIFSKDFEGPDGSRLWPLHQPPFFTLNNRLPFLLLVHTKIINNK